MTIQIIDVTAEISRMRELKNISLEIRPGEFWAILGANASGKSAVGHLLAGELKVLSGGIKGVPDRVGHVSFEKHTELIEREIRNDDTDFMDRLDPGTLVCDYICGSSGAPERARTLAHMFGMGHFLNRGLKFLSTGEIRKTILCRALMNDPQLLVLDEPYDGLDAESRKSVAESVSLLHNKGVRIVQILNRFSEISHEVTHIAYVSDCRIKARGPREEMLASGALKRLHALHHLLPSSLPDKDLSLEVPSLPEGEPLVDMKEVTVRYDGRAVLDKVSWRVDRGRHWKITGPNGAGKSTLLSLINGDNPQAYCNDITLFGRKRGTGESIWDIKKHTGMVSSRFQLDYRVSSTVLGVVVSGFFDSIGVYDTPSLLRKEIAMEWLKIIDMESLAKHPFRQLSYGEQRMALVARAMVKHPHLLILDEPCQGLDEINRNMVLKLIDHIGHTGDSTILYVTHHAEDYLSCMTDHLKFFVNSAGQMTVSVSRITG